MKFASVLTLVAAAAVVSADTNGQRMARGLPPKAPARRGTPVSDVKKPNPSTSPQCKTGSAQCCQSTATKGQNDVLEELLKLLDIDVVDGTFCGVSCSPFSGGDKCTHQPVCCEQNDYSGLVNIGCSPIGNSK